MISGIRTWLAQFAGRSTSTTRGLLVVVLLVLIINTNIITNQQAAVEDRQLEYIKHELVTQQLRNKAKQLQHRSRFLAEEFELLERTE